MSWLTLIGIKQALAETVTTAGAPTRETNMLSMLPMLVIFIIIFYFFMIRPQSKRAKEQKDLLAALSIGDEVATAGGLIGRISKLHDNFVLLSVGKNNVEIIIQKNSISSVLPKGTMENLI